MATINGSTNASVWSFKLEVVENSTSIDNNSSKLTVTAYIGRPSSAEGSYLYGANISCPVSVTGVTAKTITYSNSGQVNIASGGWLSLGSVVFDNVPHNADGTKTVTVSATFTSNVSPASGSASGSIKLTNIARASTFTIDKTTINANGTDKITVTINPKNTAYRHTVLVAFGSSYNQTFNVAAGVTTQSFTIPYEWLNGIPAQLSSNSTNIVLSTYNGTTLVGTASLPKGFTITCPDDVKPVITSVTRTGNNLRDGVYVQGKSTATIKTVAGGSYGSYITGYSCTVDGVKYTSSEFTTLPFKEAGSYTIEVTVTDSRGKTAKGKATAFTVCEYKVPYITSFTAERQSDGTTVIATLVGGVSSLNGKNGVLFDVVLNGTRLTVPATGHTVNGSVTFTGVDTDRTFVATAKAYDYYTETPATVVVPTEAVTMDFHHSGKGIAMGKVSTEEKLLDVAWPIKTRGIKFQRGARPTSANLAPNEDYWGMIESFLATSTMTEGKPTLEDGTTVDGHILHFHWDNNGGWDSQLFLRNSSGDMFVRGGNGGTWGDWKRVLDEALCKDYVIEQGTTSDGWEYTKWANGKIELWAEKYLTFPATTKMTDYLYRSIASIDLSGKLKRIIGGNCPVQYDSLVPQLCRNSTTVTKAEIVIITTKAVATFATTIPIYIIGKWK